MSEICFNLVIEKLLISTNDVESTPSPAIRFQSRNRETFDFNMTSFPPAQSRKMVFQSRNRETFDFNSSPRLVKTTS